jgi:hypothetical protein
LVGLVKEPFVGGADTMIDVATTPIPNAERGFLAVFSANSFADAQIILDWVRAEGGGIAGGQVIGATDRHGEHPIERQHDVDVV